MEKNVNEYELEHKLISYVMSTQNNYNFSLKNRKAVRKVFLTPFVPRYPVRADVAFPIVSHVYKRH